MLYLSRCICTAIVITVESWKLHSSSSLHYGHAVKDHRSGRAEKTIQQTLRLGIQSVCRMLAPAPSAKTTNFWTRIFGVRQSVPLAGTRPGLFSMFSRVTDRELNWFNISSSRSQNFCRTDVDHTLKLRFLFWKIPAHADCKHVHESH